MCHLCRPIGVIPPLRTGRASFPASGSPCVASATGGPHNEARVLVASQNLSAPLRHYSSGMAFQPFGMRRPRSGNSSRFASAKRASFFSPIRHHEVVLSHRKYFCGVAGEKPAISSHLVGFRVDLHTGVALFRIMECLPILRVFVTGRSFFASPSISVLLIAAWLTNITELLVKQRPNAPNIGR